MKDAVSFLLMRNETPEMTDGNLIEIMKNAILISST